MDDNCVAPAREPQVNAELVSMNEMVGLLEDITSSLENKLEAISRNEPPVEAEKENVRTSLVPMAEEIYSHRARANRVNERLRSLYDRLEVS